MRLFLGILISLLAYSPAQAEKQPNRGQSVGKPVAPQTPIPAFVPGVMGSIDIRPSIDFGAQQVRTENTLDIGYQFTANTAIDYTQYFNAIITPQPGGPFVGDDGFLRGRFNNIWKNVSGDLSFGMEERLYLPTAPSRANAGMITAFRTHFSLTKTLGPSFSLTLQEIPIFYIYDVSGVSDEDGNYSANPFFENRVYLIGSWQISSKLSFDLPVLYWHTLYRDVHPTAPFNGSSSNMFMIWPELDYKVAEKTVLGVAYYSGNFFDDGAFKKGVASLVFRTTL